MATSGDRCPKCGKARLKVRTSWRAGDYQKQRLLCDKCGYSALGAVIESKIWRRV